MIFYALYIFSGIAISTANLLLGLKLGFELNKWWYLPIGLTLTSILWPYVIYRLMFGKVT